MTRTCRNYRDQVNPWPRKHVTFDEILQSFIDQSGVVLNDLEKKCIRVQAANQINSRVSSINQQIDAQNERALSQITGFLSEHFSVPSSQLDELRNLLRNYFTNSCFEEKLVNFLTNIESENKQSLVKRLESQFPEKRQISSDDISPCILVPTTFCSYKNSHLVYGGVVLPVRPVWDNRVSERGLGARETPLKSHGSSYKKVTVQFKKISMEDPNLSSDIRGFLRNEIRRTNGDWYKVRNPPGYDIDHTRDDVCYCRWKDISMNRGSNNPAAERIRTSAQGPAFEIDHRISEIMQQRKADYIRMGLCVKGKRETQNKIFENF